MRRYRPSSYRPRRRPARGTDAHDSSVVAFSPQGGSQLMSTATVTPVNPMAAEGKDTDMNVRRRARANLTRMVEDPKNWNVMTRCTGWETRDLVGHMIDVMEGYFKNWEAAKAGKEGAALGLPVMGETLNDHALDFRKLPREEALARFKKDAQKLDGILEALTPEEWTSFMVYHPFAG